MKMTDCAIIIPYYTNQLTNMERYSLNAALRVFDKHYICFASPVNLKINELYDKIPVVRFDEEYFSSLQGYNQLLLSDVFYEKFLVYKYILIYQLDALVFNDELDYWCSLGFDYYGAPWLKKYWRYKYFNFFGLLKRNVGNGGFSLRRTNTFWTMSKRIRLIKRYIKFGEDIFWCNFGRYLYRGFRIVNVERAIKFSFETEPEKLFHMNNCQKPFGCHAFQKNNFFFWKRIEPDLEQAEQFSN